MILIRFLVFIPVLLAMATASIPVFPESNLIQGWQKAGTLKTFTGNNLYGHIDGGAELFLEYGFRELHVQQYANSDQEMVMECYVMSDQLAATGVYLHKTGTETPVDGVAARNSGNRFQITVVCDTWFIQVYNFSGQEKNIPVMTTLLAAVLNSCDTSDEPDVFTDLLPREHRIDGTEGIFRGEYALQPVYTFGSGDIFLLKDQGIGVYADYRDPEGEIYTHIVLAYEMSGMAGDAFEHVRQNLDPYLTVISNDTQRLIFKDFNAMYGDMIVVENEIHVRINLRNSPE